MSLPEFSVRQAVLVNILFFVCVLGGLAAYSRIPVDFFPEIGFNTTLIITRWDGASADEIERLVTTRIEDELGEVEGVKEIRSVSRANSSTIQVTFDETLSETLYKAGVNDVRAAVDRVADLPEDADEPIVRELSTKTIYSDLRVAVVDVGGLGERPLRQVTADVKSRLEDVRGVERVDIRGDHERELRVLVDRDAAARFGLTVVEIADRIRRKNLNLPAGTFSGEAGEATLRATGDYQSTDSILETVVRENADGTQVRLSDVASIEIGLEKRQYYVRYNGQPSLVLGVAKEDDADILALSRDVDRFLEEYAAVAPPGIVLRKTWDLSEWVGGRMSVLWNNLTWGVLFVMGVLWLVIGLRNGLLTVIAIPFSFLFAIMLFPVIGVTINSMSLVGMLLVSGMLVDDAIIVLENIYRKIEEGFPLRDAVVKGTEEVLWPVVAAVATTCAAFGPLLLMEGTASKFMEQLPKTVLLCLFASLFECLVVLPAHYLDFGARQRTVRSEGPAPAAGGLRGLWLRYGALANRTRVTLDAALDRLREGYLAALDVVLASPLAFGGLALALLFLTCSSLGHLDTDLFPSESSNFFVALEAPTDFGLAWTNEVARDVEREVLDPLVGEYIDDYFTTVGSSIAGNDDNRIAPNLAVSFLWIKDTPELRLKPEIAVAAAREGLEAFAARNPDRVLKLLAKPPRNGPPIGRPVSMRIVSEDYRLAKQVASEAAAFLATIPGVENIEDDLKLSTPEFRLVVDEARSTRHGLSFQDLATSLRGANDGLVASSFRDPKQDEEQDIRVMLEPRFRRDIETILQAELRTPAGYLVKLGDVADLEVSRGYLEFRHFDRERAVTVYADVDASADIVNARLAARFADVPLRHPEVELSFGGQGEETRKAMASMVSVFPVALLLIYSILAGLFRSYLQPLVVVSAIPFGLMGVVASALALDYPFSMYMMYAALGLTGVVVNDSLVMVDFINRARARGMPVLDAVRISGAQRLRPILLTTLTTVVALLPMALGLHGGSRSFGPFAATITFGLLAAMFGTLFVVPLVYTQLIRFQTAFGTRVASLRQRLFPSAPALAAPRETGGGS